MLKNATHLEKFKILHPLVPTIIESIKKDLKNEHLKNDPKFSKKYFGNKPSNKITMDELAAGYQQALQQEENAENIAEYMSNRWLLKNADIYHYFEDKLSAINPNFSELQEIEKNQSQALIEDSIKHHGAINTYLFSILNSVVFHPDAFSSLKDNAMKAKDQMHKSSNAHDEQLSLDNIHVSYQQQIAKIEDKYEKKLSGLEKKYINDTNALKKQIGNLQRKLNG